MGHIITSTVACFGVSEANSANEDSPCVQEIFFSRAVKPGRVIYFVEDKRPNSRRATNSCHLLHNPLLSSSTQSLGILATRLHEISGRVHKAPLLVRPSTVWVAPCRLGAAQLLWAGTPAMGGAWVSLSPSHWPAWLNQHLRVGCDLPQA